MNLSPLARGGAVAALAAALAVLPRGAPAQGDCGASYTVRPGDTLAGIAGRCDTTVGALVGANAVITDPARITVGWELAIPGARASLGPESEVRPRARGEDAQAALADGAYKVRPGDSFASIATALQVPMRALMAANPEVDPFGLRPGQTLRLPSDRPAPEGQGQADTPERSAERAPDRADPAAAAAGEPAPEVRASRPDQELDDDSAAERLSLEGLVQSGADCPMLETPDGEVYSLVSAEYGFTPGDYVEIEGETVEMSFCMEGSATVRVTSMSAVPAPRGG